jgi:hypothetical protein
MLKRLNAERFLFDRMIHSVGMRPSAYSGLNDSNSICESTLSLNPCGPPPPRARERAIRGEPARVIGGPHAQRRVLRQSIQYRNIILN